MIMEKGILFCFALIRSSSNPDNDSVPVCRKFLVENLHIFVGQGGLSVNGCINGVFQLRVLPRYILIPDRIVDGACWLFVFCEKSKSQS